MKYILLAGNLSEGFEAHGPFGTPEEAFNSEAGQLKNVWLFSLIEPTEFRSSLIDTDSLDVHIIVPWSSTSNTGSNPENIII